MDKKGVKDGRAQKAQINVAHNHEILDMRMKFPNNSGAKKLMQN